MSGLVCAACGKHFRIIPPTFACNGQRGAETCRGTRFVSEEPQHVPTMSKPFRPPERDDAAEMDREFGK